MHLNTVRTLTSWHFFSIFNEGVIQSNENVKSTKLRRWLQFNAAFQDNCFILQRIIK